MSNLIIEKIKNWINNDYWFIEDPKKQFIAIPWKVNTTNYSIYVQARDGWVTLWCVIEPLEELSGDLNNNLLRLLKMNFSKIGLRFGINSYNEIVVIQEIEQSVVNKELILVHLLELVAGLESYRRIFYDEEINTPTGQISENVAKSSPYSDYSDDVYLDDEYPEKDVAAKPLK